MARKKVKHEHLSSAKPANVKMSGRAKSSTSTHSDELAAANSSPNTTRPMPLGVTSSMRIISSSMASQPHIVQRFEWDHQSLQPYRKFKKLYGERKFSAPHHSKPIRGALTDLPAETRNEIYRLVLIPAQPYVESSPKTTLHDQKNSKARVHHGQRFEHKIKPSLRLLRVSRQINAEAASIYYGEMEFRFTSIKGWYFLDAFLRQIGSANLARLRKIAIHVPSSSWLGDAEDYIGEHLPESKGSLEYISLLVSNYKLRTHRYRDNEKSCVKRTTRTLEQHGTLKSFRLVIPDSYRLWEVEFTRPQYPYNEYDLMLNPSKFKNLNFELVRLHGGYILSKTDVEWDAIHMNGAAMAGIQDQRARTLETHLAARKEFRRAGYVVRDVAYNAKGYWSVEPENGEEIVAIEGDEEPDDWLAAEF
ncbi:hypothetical protein Slin15195_G059270 [Septoria linicola]|uniref:Uncharacterized protein n=1 Tax=Septoria linicola TaxID=215465 RepID=A0A9Q9EKP7_9PEZI|nr:hypothetical protein Slin14017_G075130 [Septoria linicola]USW52608.1 hypothetical protein Slin15195_G059270 [Septoria linicola]